MRATLLSCVTLVVVVLAGAPALAVDEVDWTDTTPASGRVVGDEVRVEGIGTHHLVTITNPSIEGDAYSVTGSVRYDDVMGPGYLEMWSYFADGGAYFARTLADDGPMATLTGSSGGRHFELPFLLNGAAGPERVEVNVVLPEGGTVWVGALDLEGFGPSGDWWTENQAALIGATGGILAGVSGAVIGILGGRRRSRRVVEGLLVAGAVVGVVLVVVAAAALFSGQPRHVWYPVGMLGLILAVVDSFLIPTMRRSYAAAELHRIRAFDG